MKLENQVCSLELSKKLKELGVKQESLYHYVNTSQGGEPHLLTTYSPFRQAGSFYSAFTVAELDKIIADATEGEYAFITNEELTMGYRVYESILESKELQVIRTGYKLEVISNSGIMDENPANCRAKMLIYLIENNLTNPNNNT